MSISPNVVIMTQREFADAKDEAFQRGVTRGRFEERHDRLRAHCKAESTGHADCVGLRCQVGAITGAGCPGNGPCPLEVLIARGVICRPPA